MILTTNTPYPSRKIWRIRACTHQKPQRKQDQYTVSREDQYAVLEIWNEYNILEDIKRGPYSKKPPIRRIQSLGYAVLESQLLSVSLLICLGKHDCVEGSIEGVENPNPLTLGDYSKPSHEGYWNTIELPVGNNVVPLRSDTIRLVQNGCSFHGLRSEDPNQHLKDFLKLMDSLDLDGENRERTRLLLFQFSLRDQESNWLERLPA
ncbi:hypothetical protein Tco_0535287 [Tanacetum coccineum]